MILRSPDADPGVRTVWRPAAPIDARLTLSALGRGRGDPCHRVVGDVLWRTGRTATGPVSYRIVHCGHREVEVRAWGDGAAELIASVPALLGGGDDPSTFRPRHPLLAQAHRRLAGLRIPRTGRVIEALIPAILEQRVIGLDAMRAWRWLVTRYGEPAAGPVPAGMMVPPTPQRWRSIPSWDWHRAGVDPGRARTARAALAVAGRLEECSDLPLQQAYQRLRSIPGIGVWTAAEVGSRAFGDADSVSLGDYHLPSLVGWALAGRDLQHDDVEEFLAPWRPHRQRVVRLLELTPGARRSRRGPYLTRQDHRRH